MDFPTVEVPRSLLMACALGVLVTGGCRQYQVHGDFRELEAGNTPDAADAGTLAITFLGSGGVYLQTGEVSLLADPFFTNPPLWRAVLPVASRSNTAVVDAQLRRLPRIDKLAGILVSHSHYDHAMDLPYILEAHTGDVPVYGNATLVKMLASLRKPVFDVMPWEAHRPQDWRPPLVIGGRFRVIPVLAEHLSHAFGHTYADGDYVLAQPRVPDKLSEWLLGDTFSFIIDVLDAEDPTAVALRIFYMPSAAEYPAGIPPASLPGGMDVDVAILGAAQLHQADNYPGAYLEALTPDHIFLVHWDNFVDSYRSLAPGLNYRVNPDELAARIAAASKEGARVYWPQRTAVLTLPLE